MSLELDAFVRRWTKTNKNYIGAHFLEPTISLSHFSSEYYVVIKPLFSCSSCLRGPTPKIVCPISLQNLNSPLLVQKEDYNHYPLPQDHDEIGVIMQPEQAPYGQSMVEMPFVHPPLENGRIR